MDCFQAMPVFWSFGDVTAGQDTIAEDLAVRTFLARNASWRSATSYHAESAAWGQSQGKAAA